MFISAVVSITLALVFYTVGVWSEKLQGTLKKWHIAVFWIGLLFDTVGTSMMGKIAGNGFEMNMHGITGLLAILLMLVHVIWATVVMVKNNEQMKKNFHKFSILVWLIWLVPYVSGMVVGMSK